MRRSSSKYSSWWRRLSSSSSRHLQDEYIRLSHLPSEDVFKTSTIRLDQDQYIRLGHASSRRLQDIFKTSCQDVFKTSSKGLQGDRKNVFKTSSRRLQDIFKTSCKDAFKMFWRCIIRLNCLPSSRICLGHTSEKFMVSVENLQVWYILAYLHGFSFSLYYIF